MLSNAYRACLLLLHITLFVSSASALEFQDLSFRQKSELSKRLGSNKISKIRVMTFQDMPSLYGRLLVSINPSLYFVASESGPITISKSSETEKALIEASNIGSVSWEYGSLSAQTNRGEVTLDDFYTSQNSLKLSGISTWMAFAKLMGKLDELGDDVLLESITFIHTHPSYEGVNEDQNYVIYPLHAEDLKAGSVLSETIGAVPLIISAVVPNGYSYRAYFQAGENKTMEFFSR